MALTPRLDLRQSQSLVMTPQLQQAIRLLALSSTELAGFIDEAVAANPLLELGESGALPTTGATSGRPGDEGFAAGPEHDDGGAAGRTTSLERSGVDRLIDEGHAATDRPLDVEPGMEAGPDTGADTGDGTAGHRLEGRIDAGSGAIGGGADGAGPDIDEHGCAPDTLCAHVQAQIALLTGDRALAGIACYIAGLLDDAGYLPLPLAEVADDLAVAPAEAEAALALVQACEPTGIGARSLAECIALQAREADRLDPAMARLIDNLDLVARGDLARVRRLCGVDEDDFADMLSELRGYDPKPGLALPSGAHAIVPVTPEVLVSARADGGWDIALNPATLPRLVVNRSYYVALRGGCAGDQGSRGWLADKLADATWLVKALDQRQRTILKVAAELVRQQDGFFRHGVARLKPLTLRAVADAIGMHESTVSRVTSNKFLACGRGSFELKYFFSSGVARIAAADSGSGSRAGEEGASAAAVKAAIRRLIDAEDAAAILSDDALVERLREAGFDLARRTVAKYREAIGLGSSVQRRRQKALARAGR